MAMSGVLILGLIGLGVIAMALVVFLILSLVSQGGAGLNLADRPPENITDKYILDIAQKGRKIEAIKLYRSLHGVGLKEAKDAVEDWLENG